jgi:hypothetical protein
MRRWPPIVWPLMSLASLFVLMGLSHWEWDEILIGTAVAVTVFGIAFYLATRGYDREGRPRQRLLGPAMAGVAVFYLICAAVAAVADPTFALIALLAGLIPASAVLLLFAIVRSKTEPGEEGPRDRTAGDRDDAAPGIGMDRETPVGDTPEHSDAERVAEPDRRFERDRAGARRPSRRR